jgi:hypothetical protein
MATLENLMKLLEPQNPESREEVIALSIRCNEALVALDASGQNQRVAALNNVVVAGRLTVSSDLEARYFLSGESRGSKSLSNGRTCCDVLSRDLTGHFTGADFDHSSRSASASASVTTGGSKDNGLVSAQRRIDRADLSIDVGLEA